MRARTRARIAQTLTSRAEPDANQLVEAEAYANRALNDLDVLTERYTPLIDRLVFKLDYIRIEAFVSLSEVARHRGHHELSMDISRKAQEACKKNESFAKDNAYFRNLIASVEKRLINN